MKGSTMRRFYFPPGQREPKGRLPRQAVTDCSHPGPCDADVAYWRKALRFEADPELTRAYLQGYGAWDEEELADHQANLDRLFWLLCGDRKENPKGYLYLWD